MRHSVTAFALGMVFHFFLSWIPAEGHARQVFNKFTEIEMELS